MDNKSTENNSTDMTKKSRKDVAKTADKKTTKKDKKKDKKFSFKKFFLSILILFVFFLVLGLICASLIFNSVKANTIEITDNNFWQNHSSSLIYNAEGDQIGRLSERVVDWTDLCRDAKEDEEVDATNSLGLCGDQVANISPYYIEGLIATEDQGFESHNGVDFKGMIRVTLKAIVNGNTSAGGGSSITMQLAKLLYLQPVTMKDADGETVSIPYGDGTTDKYDIDAMNSFQYKFSQMALAMKIEENYSKPEIMENYVNTMWFGDGGYGIANAADYYYGKDPADLTIAESATLAGMTQIPNLYNPYDNPDGTKERRDLVISRLESQEYITAEEATEARETKISAGLVDHSNDSAENEERLRYYDDINYYVLNELEDIFGANVDLNTGGMTIHTTVDSQLQEATIDLLDTSTGILENTVTEGTQTGTAMVDVDTGGILALGNGFDGQDEYAYSYNERRNPGSTAKPLTAYGPAIEYLGWSTAHILNDTTTYYTGTTQEVNNYYKTHSGNVTMMKALASSLNTTAVQAFQQVVDEVGTEELTAWFERVGLSEWATERTELYGEEDPQVYESYALGGFSSNPLEMASAFATFANDGVYNEPHIIDYIEFDEQSPYYDEFGEKYTPTYDSHKAMEPSTAYLITMMLNPDVDSSITTTADVSELDMAIKTGTSNWGENSFGIDPAAARDRWTVGYSPDVATAVWYGFTTEAEKQGSTFYSLPTQPLTIFRQLMEATVGLDNDKLTDGEFVMPDNVITKTVDGVTHYFIEDSDDDTSIGVKPSAPYIYISLKEANTVNVSWDAIDGAESYNVLVDGNVVDTTSDLSSAISYDTLFAQSCSSTYQIGVQAVGSSGLTSSITQFPIDNDTSNCTEATTEEETTDEEATDEEATDEEATDEEATDEEATDEEATDEEATDEEATDEEA